MDADADSPLPSNDNNDKITFDSATGQLTFDQEVPLDTVNVYIKWKYFDETEWHTDPFKISVTCTVLTEKTITAEFRESKPVSTTELTQILHYSDYYTLAEEGCPTSDFKLMNSDDNLEINPIPAGMEFSEDGIITLDKSVL